MSKRDAILTAGAELFARGAYDSVGIRDIARKAQVNSAMISYYFGGKCGLLRELFSMFSALVQEVVAETFHAANDYEELCVRTVRRFMESARSHRDLYQVGLRQMNNDSGELQDLREELMNRGWEIFSAHMDRLGGRHHHDEETRRIGFTAVLGFIFSDYLMGNGFYIDDKDRVGIYAGVLIEILQKGIPGYWR